MQPMPLLGEFHGYLHDPPCEAHRGQLRLPFKSESSSGTLERRGQVKVQDDEKETCHLSSMKKMESKPRPPDGSCALGDGGAKTSDPESLSSSQERSQPRLPHSQPQSRQRMNLSSVLKAASTRCFTVTEMMQLLSPDTTPLELSSVGPDPTSPPPSGSLLLYDRAKTPNYRDDGHDWAKKNVASYRGRKKRSGRGGEGGGGESSGNSVQIVREDSVKLRYNGQFHVAGYYARSAVRRTFRRRAYYLVDPANGSRPLSNWILVHYLDADPKRARVGRGGDAPCTLVVPSAPTNQPAAVPGAEETSMGSSSAAASTSGIDGAAQRKDGELIRRPPEALRSFVGGGVTATAIATAADNEESRRPVLVTAPGMTHRTGVPAFPAAPGAGHHRRVEDLRWEACMGDSKRGDRGTVTGDEPHGPGGGDSLPIGGSWEEATGDGDPHDLLHQDASARCWRDPTEAPGADSAAAALGVTACGNPAGGKGVGSDDTMEVDGAANPYLHMSGGQAENQPKHQHQKKQTQPQDKHELQALTPSRPQQQSQPELQPLPQPQLQTQLQPQPQLPREPQAQVQLNPRDGLHHVVASPSLARTIRSLSDLRNAPKFNDEHLAHEWRSFTEEERRELITDLYGSDMVLDGGGAGENGGTGAVDVPPSSRSFPPEDGAVEGVTTSPFIRELMAEVEALKMSLMDDAVLEGMPPDCADRAVYLEATRRCPEQASSRRMKSWFLWCENQCPKKAAHRMVRYWKKRVEYFGPERAFLPFTLGDGGALGSEEFYEEIATGFIRLAPGTDASGRGIMIMDNSKRCSFEMGVRVTMYMSQAALENESVVKNGLVLVCFGPMPVEDADRRLILERQQLLRDSLPVRIRAVHWCNPVKDTGDWISRDAHETANFTAGRKWRARVLLHQDSREHFLLQLGEYGISPSQLPAEIGGGLGDDVFRQWLESRRMR